MKSKLLWLIVGAGILGCTVYWLRGFQEQAGRRASRRGGNRVRQNGGSGTIRLTTFAKDIACAHGPWARPRDRNWRERIASGCRRPNLAGRHGPSAYPEQTGTVCTSRSGSLRTTSARAGHATLPWCWDKKIAVTNMLADKVPSGGIAAEFGFWHR